jgi:hypothetical protein
MSARTRLMVTVRRICGGASRFAMDQVPSLPDPAVREAFSSWTSWSWSGTPAQGAPAARGYASGVAGAAMMEARQ